MLIAFTHRDRTFLERECLVRPAWAVCEKELKNTGTAEYQNKFSGSLLDLRYQNKTNLTHFVKLPSLATAATFSAQTAQKHILSLGLMGLTMISLLAP